MSRRNITVYEKPEPAVAILANAIGVSNETAIKGMRALVEAGYGFGPRNPTNGMLAAYIEVTDPPRHHESVITAIGKANARWRAMLEQGTEVVLSRKYIEREDSAIEQEPTP